MIELIKKKFNQYNLFLFLYKSVIYCSKLLIIFFPIKLYEMCFNKKLFFGSLNNKGKISISIFYIEPVLRKFINKKNCLLIIINPGKHPNDFLYKKYSELFIFIGEERKKLRFILYWLFKIFIEGTYRDLNLEHGHKLRFLDYWQKFSPSINFSEKEKELEIEILEGLGLKKKNYVCFGLRDAKYYKNFTNRDAKEDTFFKNPLLSNYEQLCIPAKKNNLKIVRMGSVVGEKCKLIDESLIDYPFTKYASPFADFVLQKNAKFVISGASGLWVIAALFNVPVIMADTYLLWGTIQKYDLFIPQLYFSNKKNRFFSFQEMIQFGDEFMYEGNILKENVTFIKNSVDDLHRVFIEMNNRIDNTHISTQEEIFLQNEFKKLFPADQSKQPKNSFFCSNTIIPGSVGSDFLKKNKNLL